MKRRPGVERRRRRLAKKEKGQKEYALYSFHHDIGPINFPVDDSNYISGLTANVIGYYYEAMVYKYACEHPATRELSKFEPDGSQSNAIRAFEKISTYAPRSSSGELKRLQSQLLKETIEAAAKVAANEWINKFIQESESKDVVVPIQVSNVAHGSSAGDIQASIIDLLNNNAIKETGILEVKWQNIKDKPVQWFQLNDAALFGREKTFQQYLVDTGNWAWRHPDKIWEDTVSKVLLEQFLITTNPGLSDNQALLKWLINKGNAQSQFNNQYKVSSRMTTHGMKSSLSVQNLSDLADVLGVERGSGTMVQNNYRTRRQYAVNTITFSSNQKEIAWFGVDSLKNEKTLKGNERDPATLFAFKMWIAQKQFQQNIL